MLTLFVKVTNIFYFSFIQNILSKLINKIVCEVAREEYKIESALANIENRWGSLELVMDEHKKGYYKVKRADDIFSTLEDHMGVLSA